MTEEEIQEGIQSGKWHWSGGVGGCGNQYLVTGRDPGPFILAVMVLFAALIIISMFMEI